MADIVAADFAPDAVEQKKPNPKDAQTLEDDAARLGISEDQIQLILTLCEKCETEDRQVREGLLRQAKLHHDYFRGFQDNFWDEAVSDWRIPTSADLEAIDADDEGMGRIINIVRAHGEALISALGSTPPNSKFFPDDASVDEDITTAKAYTALEKLIYKHNDSSLLFYRVLFALFNEGITFAHNYSNQSEEYGKVTVKKPEKAKVYSANLQCPNCAGSQLHQSEPSVIPQEGEQEVSQEGEQQSNYQVPETSCPTCEANGSPQVMQQTGDVFEEEIEIESDIEIDKTHECIHIYSLLDIKIALYAKALRDSPYLRLALEEHAALTQEKFPDIFDRIVPQGGQTGSMVYERWARNDAQYMGNIPPDLNTTRIYWIRPWAFNWLGNPNEDAFEDVKFLKEKYKSGCKVTLVGEKVIAEICEESVDTHWTVSVDPLCRSLHADALVKPVIPIQDVKNDVFSLSVDTIEHGITETFVDAKVLDFDKYSMQRAQPGMKYPVKATGVGKSIAESFYQDKPATLTEEVGNFNQALDSEAQFTLGSFPSIYGGKQEGGSKTLGEYSQSRAQALQRLGLTWKRTSFFFSETMKKAVPSLAKALRDNKYDEKLVVTQGTSFINIWIKHTDLSGKIGEVTSESSEQLPVTWAQRRELILQLMNMAAQSPEIATVLAHPNNTPVIRDALGLDEIYIPGEDDRDKQYAEFVLLLEGKATMGADGMQVPSVIVNPFDDHQVEFATCRSFLCSPAGLAYKDLNGDGYENIVAHMNQHQMALQQQVQANLPGSQQGEKPESTGKTGVE